MTASGLRTYKSTYKAIPQGPGSEAARAEGGAKRAENGGKRRRRFQGEFQGPRVRCPNIFNHTLFKRSQEGRWHNQHTGRREQQKGSHPCRDTYKRETAWHYKSMRGRAT
jgi:hypothetical protein